MPWAAPGTPRTAAVAGTDSKARVPFACTFKKPVTTPMSNAVRSRGVGYRATAGQPSAVHHLRKRSTRPGGARGRTPPVPPARLRVADDGPSGACPCSAASARPVATCATIAGRVVPVREPRRTGGRCPATAAPGRVPVPGGRAPLCGGASYEAEG